MGLNQGDRDTRRNSDFLAWVVPGITVAIAALLAATGDWGRELLRYDRLAIASGELWRLIGGHFVHLSWSHFVLNGIGFVLICYLVAARFRVHQWFVIAIAVIAGIDMGFWFLQPQLVWYVGLSGLLHGLLAAGLVGGIRDQHKECWFIGALLTGKLVYEQLVGPLPGSEGTVGGDVVVAAHLYGAVSGALAGLFLAYIMRGYNGYPGRRRV